MVRIGFLEKNTRYGVKPHRLSIFDAEIQENEGPIKNIEIWGWKKLNN